MIARYRVLFGVPGFGRLLVSSVLARMPSGMFSLAILLFVRQQTGSFLVAGLAVGAFTLTGAAVSPVQGALVDRFGQPRVLLPCALGQGGLLAGFVLIVQKGAPPIAIAGLAALAGALLPPVSGCVRALWSEVTRDAEALELAYSLDAITQEVIYTLGPLLAGSLAVLVSPSAAVLSCAAVALAGTVFFATCEASRRWRAGVVERSRGGALASPGLRALLGSVVFAGMMIGAVEVGLPALAVHLGSRGSAGVLLALFSLGSMAGGVLYSARNWRARIAGRYAVILLALGFLVAPLVLVHALSGALLLSPIAGLGVAPMLACQFSLVGALAPAGTTTEAFTWHRGTTVAGIALGSALGGLLVDRLGVSGPFALACLVAELAFVLAVLGRRRIEPKAKPTAEPSTELREDDSLDQRRARVPVESDRAAQALLREEAAEARLGALETHIASLQRRLADLELRAQVADLERRVVQIHRRLDAERATRERSEQQLESTREGHRAAERIVRELRDVVARLTAAAAQPALAGPDGHDHEADAPARHLRPPTRGLRRGVLAGSS